MCIETPTTGRFQETLRGKEQDCHSGRRDESNECRSNLSVCCGTWHGCSDKERRCDRKEIWPVQAIESLKALGYKTAALALTDDSVSIDDPQLMSEEKLAVILGTEGDGLMQETIKACDYTVKIPMSHGVDSLNVAAASAVAFWQLRK